MTGGWRLMQSELRVRRWGVALGVATGLMWALARVAGPYLVKVAIDRGITGRDVGALTRWTAAVVVVGVVAAACAGARRYLAFREARIIETSLRARLFAHTQSLDFAYFDRSSAGDLMSRSNSDLLQIQNFLNMIPFTLGNALQIAAVTVILIVLNPLLALCALGALPLVNLLGRRFSLRLHPSMTGIQRASARVAAVVEETVAGTRVVKGLGAEPVQQAKLEAEADGLYRAAMGAVRTRAQHVPALELLPNFGLLLVVAVGGHMVLDGSLTLGELVAFNVYVTQLIWPLRALGFVIAMGQRAVAAAERVAEVLDARPAVAAPARPIPLPAKPRGEVRFEGVRFAYPSDGAVDAPPDGPGPEATPTAERRVVLDGFDLVVHPGETVALVGATGSGKSTVPRLLARFYDVDDGRVLLDGVDVRDVALPELRRAVGIVFEDTFLFTDSIAANIAFADPATDAGTIRWAAELAGATEFVDTLRRGFDTEVGERGYSLSGGQRQRLAIARALVAQPRVLVLDDATSAIDPSNEREILAGLATAAKRTTLVISHRPATIALADRVVFIDGGRVAAAGTHEELLVSSGRYGEVLAAAVGETA